MRDSFIFYRSFYEAAKFLPEKERFEVYTAIIELALNGNDITDSLSDIAKAIFIMAKPQIEANLKKYQAGKKGAEKRWQQNSDKKQNSKQTNSKQIANEWQDDSKPIAKQKQDNSKAIANVNVNVNENENENVNDIKERGEVLRKNNTNLHDINSNENVNNEKKLSSPSSLEKNKSNQIDTKNNPLNENKSNCEKTVKNNTKLPENVVPLSKVINKITKNKSSPEENNISPTTTDFNFAQYMRDYFKQKVSHFNISQKELEVWATYVARIRKKYKANETDLIEVFKFAMNEPFWQQVIMNPYHLYKNWNKLILQKKAQEDPYYELKKKIAEEEKQEQANENI